MLFSATSPGHEWTPVDTCSQPLLRWLWDALLTGFPAGQLREALADVVAADALIVVSPTFQASYSGLFKSFVDLIEMDQLRGTPVLLAATGGTERHSLVIEHALRPLFAHLGAFPVPTGVYAATADFGGDYAPALAAPVTRAAQELARLAAGGSTSGSSLRRPPVDEFAQVTPSPRCWRRRARNEPGTRRRRRHLRRDRGGDGRSGPGLGGCGPRGDARRSAPVQRDRPGRPGHHRCGTLGPAKELCAHSLVERIVEAGPPVAVSYHLTRAGRDVEPVLDAIRAFGLRHPRVGARS